MSCPMEIASKVWDSLLTNRITQAAVGVAAVALLIPKLVANRKRAALAADRATFKKDVVYMYGFPRGLRSPHFSFWCFKVETFLRMAHIPYVYVPTWDAALVSPTGRVPCVVLNGQVYTDSAAIVEVLTQKFSVKLDQGLTSDQTARALGITRTIQASTYPSHERSFIVDHPEVLREIMITDFGMNKLLVPLAARGFRKNVIEYLNVQGNGDLPDAVYLEEFLRDVKMLELFVSKSSYVLGDKVTSADADAFSILFGINVVELARCPVYQYVKNSKPIQDYLKKIQAAYWKDMKEVCAKRGGKQEYLN